MIKLQGAVVKYWSIFYIIYLLFTSYTLWYYYYIYDIHFHYYIVAFRYGLLIEMPSFNYDSYYGCLIPVCFIRIFCLFPVCIFYNFYGKVQKNEIKTKPDNNCRLHFQSIVWKFVCVFEGSVNTRITILTYEYMNRQTTMHTYVLYMGIIYPRILY